MEHLQQQELIINHDIDMIIEAPVSRPARAVLLRKVQTYLLLPMHQSLHLQLLALLLWKLSQRCAADKEV